MPDWACPCFTISKHCNQLCHALTIAMEMREGPTWGGACAAACTFEAMCRRMEAGRHGRRVEKRGGEGRREKCSFYLQNLKQPPMGGQGGHTPAWGTLRWGTPPLASRKEEHCGGSAFDTHCAELQPTEIWYACSEQPHQQVPLPLPPLGAPAWAGHAAALGWARKRRSGRSTDECSY